MLATGGTGIAAVNRLKEWGAQRIKLICICASADGLEALFEQHPDVEVFCAAVDSELDEHGYLIPGLGDGTCKTCCG
jgi:uracil phosphoribosyltransferase